MLNNTDQIDKSENTSSGSASEGNPATNSGESMVQGPKDIVNEQEQNKPVNQEEFIDDVNANTASANNMKDGLPTTDDMGAQQVKKLRGDDGDEALEPPSMKGDK